MVDLGQNQEQVQIEIGLDALSVESRSLCKGMSN